MPYEEEFWFQIGARVSKQTEKLPYKGQDSPQLPKAHGKCGTI